MSLKDILESELEKEWLYLVGNITRTSYDEGIVKDVLQRKKQLFSQQELDIVKVEGTCKIQEVIPLDIGEKIIYDLYVQCLIRDKQTFYIEEKSDLRSCIVVDGVVIDHIFETLQEQSYSPPIAVEDEERFDKKYNRIEAVKYAQVWWNGKNPRYQRFTNDCTNFISQCLFAGGMPMSGYGQVQKGWWYGGSKYSYSWTVANSLLYYLIGSKKGIRGKQASSAKELNPGDIIFYDFEGDGRFDHSTIVVEKTTEGHPLVNAHTQDSRNRFWTYEDSSRYTPNMQYRFISIVDG